MSLSARPSYTKRKMRKVRMKQRPKTSYPKKSSLSIQIEGMERHLKSLHPKKRKFSLSTLRSMVKERSNLTSLRRENSELKKNLARLIQQSMNSGGSAINPNSSTYHSQHRMTAEQRKLEKLDRRVHSLRNLYDQLRSSRRIIEKANQRKLDLLRDLELESKPVLDENPKMSKKIVTLETKLDRCLIKYNEVLERNERDQEILNELRIEQRQFDHRLNEIEKSLVEKSSDGEHLRKMCVKARAMKEKARASLHELLSEVKGLRSRKEKEITRKMRFVGEKIALTKRMTCREERRRNVQYFGKEKVSDTQPHKGLLMRFVVNKISDRVGERRVIFDKKRLEILERKYMKLRELSDTSINGSKDEDEDEDEEGPTVDSKYQYHHYVTSSEKVYDGIIRKLSQLYEKRMKLNESVEESRKKNEEHRNKKNELSVRLNEILNESMIHSSSIRTSQRLLENLDKSLKNHHVKHLEELKKEYIRLNTTMSNLYLFLTNMNQLCEDVCCKLFHFEDSSLHIVIPEARIMIGSEDEEEGEEGERFEYSDLNKKKGNLENFSKIKETLFMLEEFGNYSFEIYKKFRSFFDPVLIQKEEKKEKEKEEKKEMSEKFRRTSISSIGEELDEGEEKFKNLDIPDISQIAEFSISPKNIRIEIPGEDDGEEDESDLEEDECVDKLFTKICGAATTTGKSHRMMESGVLQQQKKYKKKKKKKKKDEEEESEGEKEFVETEVEEIFDRRQIKFMSRLAVIRGKKRASFQAKMKDLESEKRKRKRSTFKFWRMEVPVPTPKINRVVRKDGDTEEEEGRKTSRKKSSRATTSRSSKKSRKSGRSTTRSKNEEGVGKSDIPMSPQEILLRGDEFVDLYREDYLYDEIIDDGEGEDDGEFVLPH